jgi:hypothetical protein
MKWTSGAWVAKTDISDPAGAGLNAGKIWVGNANNQAAVVAVSGDASLDNAGALTLGDSKVTSVKIADTAVTMVKLAPAGAVPGKVIKMTSSGWAPATDETGTGFPGYGSSTTGVAASSDTGSATTVSRSDHKHKGVHLVVAGTGILVTGDSASKVAFDTAFTVPNADSSDVVDTYHAGNLSGQVAVSNGTLCTNLNASKLEGNQASAFALSGHNHDAAYVKMGQKNAVVDSMIKPSAVDSSKIANRSVALRKIERGATSGRAIIAQGIGNDPVWGYPDAVGTGGTPVTFIKTDTFALQLPAISGNSVYQATVSIPQLQVGDRVFLSHPTTGTNWTNIQGLGNCQVTAAGTLTFRVWNSSGASVTPALNAWRYIWIRPSP